MFISTNKTRSLPAGANTLLRCLIAEDILVEASIVGALVPAPCAGRCIEGSALFHIGSGRVLILGHLALIDALDSVAPVSPRAKGEVPYRGDPEVVACEWDRPVAELLVIGIAGDIGHTRCACPGVTEVIRQRGPYVERWHRATVGAIPDGSSG